MTWEREVVEAGRVVLGIELGSTRIKAVLTDTAGTRVAAGTHAWQSHLEGGHWTYAQSAIDAGLAACMTDLRGDLSATHGLELRRVAALGVSAMMHGYIALDEDDRWLVPFRTWRDTTTATAAGELSQALGVNIPQRWSVAHLYQAHLDDEAHLGRLARLTTLAGWVHRRLTGEHVLGVGDASGMFPIDPATGTYDERLLARVDDLLRSSSKGTGVARPLVQLLPRVLPAGVRAGVLTVDGARLLDETGTLAAGSPLCPPEGDAGTGMVATNSVRPGTANVSVGTSVFAMTVLDAPWRGTDPNVDIVCTPAGHPVAMVHANNGASELDAWADVFADFARRLQVNLSRDQVFRILLESAADGASDAGGVIVHNFLAGEPVAGVTTGHPLVVRSTGHRLSLPDLVKAHVYAIFGALALGMRSLRDAGVTTDNVVAHGGVFRTEGVAQHALAAAFDTPVTVLQGAGEGGAWGMAVLAALMVRDELDLATFLDRTVFATAATSVVTADPAEVAGFAAYLSRFDALLPLQEVAARLG
ncbi:xylulokinase [Humibacillus xanthopallidus]|uniref:Sugar (Pentulose or hexulose) kinase n=1 Tax=Humibacillus xanthopallidus TaxID=412689 RepID=A0A543HZJ9_9MICO|nr:FGGY-family carbohydrate kinase [Humibacillus xanthopallidus]TQM63766.1 sugar (pentulose or hexulose) kinase [Humibacillus xanthopallidus]